MKKYSKTDFLNILLIIASFFVIFFIVLKNGNYIYGSEIDFSKQHYLIPEYFRELFYDTKNFFPSFAFNLGMGQNIFNFSYYGLFNPIIMLSYFLPFLNIEVFLKTTIIISLVISSILFYLFISNHFTDKKIRFITSFLFIMATPLILHSHRHIMFINYMPFLLLALFGVERYLNDKKSALLIISLLLIITTSYFFSIPALITVFLYGLFLMLDKKKIKIGVFFKESIKLISRFIIPILIAGVLLLPTFKAILNSRFEVKDPISFLELLIPNINFSNILYSSYSLGLTAVFIFSVIYSIFSKKKNIRFLGIIFALIITFPIFNYILNGFMYLNGKVFIPFIPLALLLVGYMLNTLPKNKKVLKKVVITFVIVSVLGCIFYKYRYLYIIDSLITLGFLAFYFKKKKIMPLVITLAIISFSISLGVNTYDKLTEKDILTNQYDKEIDYITSKINKENTSLYRTVDNTNLSYNANNIRNINMYKTTMYSSLTNKYYKNFYWNTFNTENPNRNESIFSDVSNPLFNIYFANRYYISNDNAPIGYEKVNESKNVKSYENKDVFSLGYVNYNFMSEKEFNNLKYPYNVEALLNYTILKDAPSSSYKTNLKDVTKEIYNFKDSYSFELNDDKTYKLKLNDEFKDKILIINFEMKYSQDCKDGDTYIRINDSINKLTCKSWKYHNENYDFGYMLSNTDTLDIEISKGKYIISNIKVYALDYNLVKNIKNGHDEFIINKKKTKGDIIAGEVNARENGYFTLSIPYDEGYNIYVDGKKVEYEIVNTSFIGFKIEKGYHDITIKYEAPLLNIGKKVSVLGIILFALVIVLEKRRKNEKNINDSTML